MIRHQSHFHFAGHILLDMVKHGFHITENRVEIHGFMHLLSVPACYLVFPVELSFRKHMLFEQMMRLDDD